MQTEHKVFTWVIAFTTVTTLFAGVSSAAPVLSLASVSLEQGQTAVLTLSATGLDPSWAGINATIQLPDGVDLVNATSTLEPAFDFDYHFDAGSGQASVILYSVSASLGSNPLALADLHVVATQAATVGEAPVVFVEGLTGIATADGTESVPHATVNGLLNILAAAVPLLVWPVVLLLGLAGLAQLRRRQGAPRKEAA